MYYQQGDVLIKPVNQIQKGEELKHLVLAEGEVTGHKHQIVSGVAKLIMFDKIMQLQVFSDTALLKHNKHGKIEIPKGDYTVEIVKEYDPFDEAVRRVAD